MTQEETLNTPDDITPPLKVCTKCGQEKPASAFASRKNRRSGLQSACRECDQSRGRDYYAANRTQRSAHIRAYNAEHKKALAGYAAQWRAANREAIAARMAAYYQANREKRDAYRKAYRAAHREADRAYAVVYDLAHPEAVRDRNRRRRALKAGAEGTHTAEDVQGQYDRQKGKCFYCRKKLGKKYHVDHVTPLSKGGSDGPENLVIACGPCNLTKHAKHPMDFCGRLL